MNPWKERILNYNRQTAENRQKAGDLDAIIRGLAALPPGQLKKLLTDEVKAVLQKYGYEEE